MSVNAQITRVSQVRDVTETDSHYEALKNLIENYGAFQPYPDATFRADKPLTRGEFAKQLEDGLRRMREVAEEQDVDFKKFTIYSPYSGNKKVIGSAEELKDLPPTNEYYFPIRTLIEDYGIDLSDEGYFRPEQSVTEKELATWVSVVFDIEFKGTPSPTKIITRGVWVKVMSNSFDSMQDEIYGMIGQQKTDEKTQPTPTPTPKPTPSKANSVESLITEADNYRKAGKYSLATISYKDAANLTSDAATKLKCGIGVYQIAKFLMERDSGDDPISEGRREEYAKDLELAINFFSSAILSDKTLVEAYRTRAAAYRLLKKAGIDKTKEAEADERKVKELGGNNSSITTKSKLEIINSLPSLGKARITGKGSFYLPDNPCADLSKASADLQSATEKGGIWGSYKMNKGDVGDIIFETNNKCDKGKLVLLRVGTAIVTIGANDVKRIK